MTAHESLLPALARRLLHAGRPLWGDRPPGIRQLHVGEVERAARRRGAIFLFVRLQRGDSVRPVTLQERHRERRLSGRALGQALHPDLDFSVRGRVLHVLMGTPGVVGTVFPWSD